ncbi:MAG: signal peptidase II [Chloroflexota bacterium]
MTEGRPGVATGTEVVPATVHPRAHWPLFFGIAATVVVLDQIAKAWLVANVSPGEIVEVVGDWVRLILSQNSGALFGLFRDNAVLFGLVSLGVIGLIVAYHGRSGRSLYMSVALGLLLGGAVGNLVDRLRLGYVVDFIDIGIGDWRFYTFNLADSAITLSILLLVGAALFPVLTRLGERPADG